MGVFRKNRCQLFYVRGKDLNISKQNNIDLKKTQT